MKLHMYMIAMILSALATVPTWSVELIDHENTPAEPVSNFDPPFQMPHGVTMKRDVLYATVDGQALHLDLFLPESGPGPFPAVLYVHGGLGSSLQAKAQFHRQAAYMASQGFVGACVQYRKLPEARFPAAIFDLKAAVRWLRAHAAEYRIDAEHIGAAGASGGGTLVGMLGTTINDPVYEGQVGNALGFSSRISAVAALNPAVDLVDYRYLSKPQDGPNYVVYDYVNARFSKHPEIWVAASPLYDVSPKSVPFLLLHGDADTNAPYSQTSEMAKRLHAAGVPVELFTASGGKHGFF